MSEFAVQSERCFGNEDEKMRSYHDEIWGKPETGRVELFASLCLQMFQCGLSWKMVWNKKDNFYAAFDNFDYNNIAKFNERDVSRLLTNPGIVRNAKKIREVINNAKICVRIDKEEGGIDRYIWNFVRNIPESERILKGGVFPNSGHMRTDLKTKGEDRHDADGVHPTAICMTISDRMKNDGFLFCGPVTILSFLQASGLVNHHRKSCLVFTERDREWKSTRDRMCGREGEN